MPTGTMMYAYTADGGIKNLAELATDITTAPCFSRLKIKKVIFNPPATIVL